jgi:hypothetical protein
MSRDQGFLLVCDHVQVKMENGSHSTIMTRADANILYTFKLHDR